MFFFFFFALQEDKAVCELETSVAALKISDESSWQTVETPDQSQARHSFPETPSQSAVRSMCITGTPSLAGTRTVALDQSNLSSLKITVTFDKDKQMSPPEVAETEKKIASPRTENYQEERGTVAETPEQISDLERSLSSPSNKDNNQSKQGELDDAKSHITYRKSRGTKGTQNVTEIGEVTPEMDAVDQQVLPGPEKPTSASEDVTTHAPRSSSSLSELELKRGSMTDSPGSSVFRGMSRTSVSEVNVSRPKYSSISRGCNSPLLYSEETPRSAALDNVFLDFTAKPAKDAETESKDKNAIRFESDASFCGSAPTPGNDSSAGTLPVSKTEAKSHENSNTEELPSYRPATNGQCSTPSDKICPYSEDGKAAKLLPAQLQRLRDDYASPASPQNQSGDRICLDQSLTELDIMAPVRRDATSTPAVTNRNVTANFSSR